MKFRNDFLFGAASAAYQVEGAWDQDGKGLSNWDVFSKIPGKTLNGTNGDVAVDHYHRYKEDIALMAEQGLDSYRFSIAWTRIYPNGDGQVNQKGLDFYNAIIDECLKYGIVPFVTLYHWDLPESLQADGGWLNKRTLDAFEQFAKTCFESFSDRVKHWITFNETVVFIRHGYIFGAHPPGRINQFKEYYQALHNVFLTHAKVVLLYKETLKLRGDIGITHVFAPAFSIDDKKENLQATEHVNAFDTHLYYDPILLGTYPQNVVNILKEDGHMFNIGHDDLDIMARAAKLNDFMGINYYQPQRIKALEAEVLGERSRENSTGGAGGVGYDGKTASVLMDDKVYTKWNWEISPESLELGLISLKERYGDVPYYITENGLGDHDSLLADGVHDLARIEYIKGHLKHLQSAIAKGVDIRGYFAWSFTDLLSWLNGFEKQYGFVYVDHTDDLKRIKKDSYIWYKEVIKTRGSNL